MAELHWNIMASYEIAEISYPKFDMLVTINYWQMKMVASNRFVHKVAVNGMMDDLGFYTLLNSI